jgi:hypothetical protein
MIVQGVIVQLMSCVSNATTMHNNDALQRCTTSMHNNNAQQQFRQQCPAAKMVSADIID